MNDSSTWIVPCQPTRAPLCVELFPQAGASVAAFAQRQAALFHPQRVAGLVRQNPQLAAEREG